MAEIFFTLHQNFVKIYVYKYRFIVKYFAVTCLPLRSPSMNKHFSRFFWLSIPALFLCGCRASGTNETDLKPIAPQHKTRQNSQPVLPIPTTPQNYRPSFRSAKTAPPYRTSHRSDRWDISNVTSLEGMFQNAQAFNQPLNTWNTSKLTELEHTFWGADHFNQPLDHWDVSNVTSFYETFRSAESFN